MIRTLGICTVIVALMIFIVFAIIRGEQRARLETDAAIQRCRAMNGEAIMSYSANSDAFYLTGCKLK
jgi:hypothetical protein